MNNHAVIEIDVLQCHKQFEAQIYIALYNGAVGPSEIRKSCHLTNRKARIGICHLRSMRRSISKALDKKSAEIVCQLMSRSVSSSELFLMFATSSKMHHAINEFANIGDTGEVAVSSLAFSWYKVHDLL